jgi:hypothetical protein
MRTETVSNLGVVTDRLGRGEPKGREVAAVMVELTEVFWPAQ